MGSSEAELVKLQIDEVSPTPRGLQSATDLIIPPVSTADRMRHFSEEIYDLSPESDLSIFVKTILGDAGIGMLRKRMVFARLRQALQGTHFYDLDRFYGALFGFRRSREELLSLNPYEDEATAEVWAEEHAKDASYRSRIEQFARALKFGATPTGMEMVAEAVLSVDCEVDESWVQADESYRTYAELEADYPTYADMEDEPYSTLEGAGLARLSGNDRREFVIRPHRQITEAEKYDLVRVLDRVKPADARFVIESQGVPIYSQAQLTSLWSDSEWVEVLRYETEVEVPRPPFTAVPAEDVSYVGDVIGIIAYQKDFTGKITPRLLPQRTIRSAPKDWGPEKALKSASQLKKGKQASDGKKPAKWVDPRSILPPHKGGKWYPGWRKDWGIPKPKPKPKPVTPPPEPPPSPPKQEYYVSPPRRYDPNIWEDIIEISFNGVKEINYVTLDVARYPHHVFVEGFNPSTGMWDQVVSKRITYSIPRTISNRDEGTSSTFGRRAFMDASQEFYRTGHPDHLHPDHWETVTTLLAEPAHFQKMRMRLVRIWSSSRDDVFPPKDFFGKFVEFSLAMRKLDIGFRGVPSEPIQTVDIVTTVTIESHNEPTSGLLETEPKQWRSSPQPVNYAVVNLYLDTRDNVSGDPQIIDRFYLEPTHTGAHITIYYSNDEPVGEADPETNEEAFEDLNWIPIPREYTLQKGYLHIPPTLGRFFKFEFTNLTAEPYEVTIPIMRQVKMFSPVTALEYLQQVSPGQALGAMGPGMSPSDQVAALSPYSDAINLLRDQPPTPEQQHSQIEALYPESPIGEERLRDISWAFGYTPWHQGFHAPRFVNAGKHVYTEIEVRHSTRLAFFVGLKKIEAYRLHYDENDNTQVYVDYFHDFTNLTPGFTWQFDTGMLHSELDDSVEATSKTFVSRNAVKAVQFATQQSAPKQLLYDDDFRDPALATYDWQSPDNWNVVGDAQLLYLPQEHSVRTIRYATPPIKTIERTGGLVQRAHKPPYHNESFSFEDEAATAALTGGLQSSLVQTLEGEVHAAVRVTFEQLTSPLKLQIVSDLDGSILAEKEITGEAEEEVEESLTYVIGTKPNDENIRARLVQTGKSDSMWKLDTLSLFDDGIIWEFSNDGGGTWVPAHHRLRNNPFGVLTFPEPGNFLRYRVKGTRQRVAVSAIQMRPWYVGVVNSRVYGVPRGPNVSVYDSEPPIQEDPMFKSWSDPVPFSWYRKGKKFSLLVTEGVPNITVFSRFYGRPIDDTVAEPVDTVASYSWHPRTGMENVGVFFPIVDTATRSGTFSRTPDDTITISDAVLAFKIEPSTNPLIGDPFHPVF